MGWSEYRSANLTQLLLAGGGLPLPIKIRSYNQRPVIRSVLVVNQSTANIGIFPTLLAGQSPLFVVPSGTITALPIVPTTDIIFAFQLLTPNSNYAGLVYLLATEDVLATSSASVPVNTGGIFILDQSLLDSPDALI